MNKIVMILVLALAPFLPAIIGAADAKHLKHVIPHHAHLVKHPHQVGAHVIIPRSAFVKRAAAHHRKKH